MKRYALTLLVFANLALALILGILWVDRDGNLRNVRWKPPSPLAVDYQQMLPALPERTRVDTRRFMALLERPLFSPTRRPPPPPPPPAAAPLADNFSTAQLSGVFVSGNTAGVIINIAGKTRRLRINESVDGWVLHAVQGRSVTFASGGETRVLQLPRAALSTFSGQALSVAPLSLPPAPASPPPVSGGGATDAEPSVAPKAPRKSRFGP